MLIGSSSNVENVIQSMHRCCKNMSYHNFKFIVPIARCLNFNSKYTTAMKNMSLNILIIDFKFNNLEFL
jgi:hypothetical protein